MFPKSFICSPFHSFSPVNWCSGNGKPPEGEETSSVVSCLDVGGGVFTLGEMSFVKTSEGKCRGKVAAIGKKQICITTISEEMETCYYKKKDSMDSGNDTQK